MAQAAMEISDEEDIIKVINFVIEEAKRTLQKTPDMLPILKEAGVIDAGGQGLIYIFEGGLMALKGEVFEKKEKAEIEVEEHIQRELLEFKFDTVLLAFLGNFPRDSIKNDLAKFGDSIVVADAGDLTKIHIHSNEPNKVIAYVLDKGEIKEAHIENMQLQTDEFTKAEVPQKKTESRFNFSIVTVAQGEGFKKLFESIGVDEVVEGGQTMNPSISDILNAINRCSKDTVLVLPNNSNVILAAEEAKKLAKDKKVIIIPTKNPTQAVPVILCFNHEDAVEENVSRAMETIGRIHTLEITYSTRDAKLNSLKLKENDIIGIFDDEIMNVNTSPEETFLELLKIAKEKVEDVEFISIYYGKDVEKEKAEELLKRLQDEFKDIEFDLIYGGQPFYFYLASIE